MGVASAEKCKAVFSTLQIHKDCPFLFICSHHLRICFISSQSVDTFSQKVTPSVRLHAILFCLPGMVSLHSQLRYTTCNWAAVSLKGFLSSPSSLAAIWTPPVICLLCISYGAEVCTYSGCCFRVIAPGASWRSQIVSIYANFGWLMTTNFRESATTSRVCQRHSRHLEDQA